MPHLNLEKLMVLDKHHRTSEWTYFLKRKNKRYTLEQARENLKKRRAEYFIYKYDNNPLIIKKYFGTKKMGFYTYDGLIKLLEKTEFFDKNYNYHDEKIVDLLDYKPKNPADKYDVKINLSYEKTTDYTPCVRDYGVRYEDDNEETWFYTLTTKIYFDDILVGDYESSLEDDYLTKYFVYNINNITIDTI